MSMGYVDTLLDSITLVITNGWCCATRVWSQLKASARVMLAGFDWIIRVYAVAVVVVVGRCRRRRRRNKQTHCNHLCTLYRVRVVCMPCACAARVLCKMEWNLSTDDILRVLAAPPARKHAFWVRGRRHKLYQRQASRASDGLVARCADCSVGCSFAAVCDV